MPTPKAAPSGRASDADAAPESATAGPLAGRRIAHGRPSGQGAALSRALLAAGALEAIAIPLIGIAPPRESRPLDQARDALAAGSFDAVAFTSVNAVAAIGPIALPPGVAVAAVGPGTMAALEAANMPATVAPPLPPYSAASLAAHWHPRRGTRVLLPCSDRAGATLPDALRERGCTVTVVTAYRTAPKRPGAEMRARLASGEIDALVVTSSSSVEALRGVTLSARTAIVAIGEPTASAARAGGLRVTATAGHASDAGIVDTLSAIFSAPGPRPDADLGGRT